MLGPNGAITASSAFLNCSGVGRMYSWQPGGPDELANTSACLHQEGGYLLLVSQFMRCRQAGHLLPGKDPWLLKAVAARWTAAPLSAAADRQQEQVN